MFTGDMKAAHRLSTGTLIVREQGGGASNSGQAVIICGPHGEKLEPLSIPKGESQGVHAIFKAEVGMHIAEAIRHRDDGTIVVYRIDGIGTQENPDELLLTEVGRCESGDDQIPDEFFDVAHEAWLKAGCYHCKEPHFVVGQEEVLPRREW